MVEKSLQAILIVDDEPRNRRLLDAFLSAEGYVAIHASNGQEALALAIEKQPGALLLDLMMPDMDGFQVLQKLKDNPATQAIPVMIVSALDDLAARQRVLASGADDFLGKPVDRWELSLRLQRLLHKGEAGGAHDN
ncbi:response regulator [Iodobacter sp. HSC-16F04]|uniref:Response regulator n=1 Tax=Iodobacter violaceini TaxID=3044271 RepID=A0ABX0KMF6_9NEIS|nr:response regulator [Iodobacter violacea]NHQ85285.1 response regulator [Iodobacter violacea]